jgi:hypothetical protein
MDSNIRIQELNFSHFDHQWGLGIQ